MTLKVNATNISDTTYASQCANPTTCVYGYGRTAIGTVKYTWLAVAPAPVALGGRVTDVVITQDDSLLTSSLSSHDDYRVYDLYGSYKVDENATLRFAVNNVTDLAYVPALGLVTYPAPGRTATATLNLKF